MLAKALSGIRVCEDPNVLVGYDLADDGGVYRLDQESALVQTVDFFTPIVDDPFVYGQIAAANSLSDIYAMGGTPRFAVSIVEFPADRLEGELLHEILRGGTAKMNEAEVTIIGGHSAQGKEVKFGFCVTGLVNPERVYRNSGAQPGDAVLLTKPLGTGIITAGIKCEKAPPAASEAAIRWMLQLNSHALEIMRGLPIHSVTDVTGYGLLGHAWEMAVASDVTLAFQAAAIPVMDGVKELARQGILPKAVESNRRYVKRDVVWGSATEFSQEVMFDPQTSGGLLVCLPEAAAKSLSARLKERGYLGAQIGTVIKLQDTHIQVEQ